MVIEKDGNGERAYDIYSRLLKDRIIMLTGPIDENVSNVVMAQLLHLAQHGDDHIDLYINSPGGVVTAGMAIYDTMHLIEAPVHTYVLGQACSMGSLLACAGDPGNRFILPNARHMIHQPSGGSQGQASDIIIQANEIIRWKEVLTQVYVKHTGQPFDRLSADMDRDNFMTAEESVEYGLADKILEA